MARFGTVPLPDLGLGACPPETTVDEYRGRVVQTTTLMKDRGLDHLIVYGDREYFGDLYHLTGVDPRFEEGILVLDSNGSGTMLLGNENFNFGPAREIGHTVLLWQELSLAGQRRDVPVTLESLLAGAGVGAGCRVAINGQKQLSEAFFADGAQHYSAPSYLVDALRRLVGPNGHVQDGKPLFTDPDFGVRATATAHDIAIFEYGAAITSLSVLSLIQGLDLSLAADVLSDRLISRGLPATAHPMVNFGPRNGLYSPRPILPQVGQVYQFAQGVRGGLTCRAGVVARSADDLDPQAAAMFEPLVLNYFDVLLAWHESVKVGARGADVFDAVDVVRDPDLFDFLLNPGHNLHYEEWSQTSISKSNGHAFRSGEMLQCDVIPVVSRQDISINIEDGVALADEELRSELANDYPELWERVEKRKSFLTQEIGVTVDDSLLPMSNIPLWHAPYAFDLTTNLIR